MKYIIHTDGGARGNPGPAAAAFVVTDDAGRLIHRQGVYLGSTTNNVAEYQAVKQALLWLKSQVETEKSRSGEIEMYLDSLLVVEQLTGRYRLKSAPLIKAAADIHRLMATLGGGIRFYHVTRNSNQAADRLVNQTLDGRASDMKNRWR